MAYAEGWNCITIGNLALRMVNYLLFWAQASLIVKMLCSEASWLKEDAMSQLFYLSAEQRSVSNLSLHFHTAFHASRKS